MPGPKSSGADSAAAIVLCGGRSRRMGRDKAALPFGSGSLAAHVIRRLPETIDEVWIVAREGQELPADLPAHVSVARDTAEGLGPLAGIAAGLRAISSARAFVTGCDSPHLDPALVAHVLAIGEGRRLTIPRVDGHLVPTCAVYARSLLETAESLLAEKRLRPVFLLEALDPDEVRIVSEDELREVDPDLRSLVDCDTPEAYREALREAGL